MGASMIKALAGIDPKEAVGILARAAVALDGDVGNPAAKPSLLNEEAIRQRVLLELRSTLGLGEQDDTKATDLLYEAIDAETDRLAGAADLDKALERLSERGELPSDQYIVSIMPTVRELYGPAFETEAELIRQTVREPHAEQHFGPYISDEQPSLASLFARRFWDKYPQRDFVMLVGGWRKGLKLTISHAWRVYPSVVNLDGITALTDISARFAEKFGYPITVGDRSGKFILAARVRLPIKHGQSETLLKIDAPKTARLQAILAGVPRGEGYTDIAFAMAIDTVKYRRTLAKYSPELRKFFRHGLIK